MQDSIWINILQVAECFWLISSILRRLILTNLAHFGCFCGMAYLWIPSARFMMLLSLLILLSNASPCCLTEMLTRVISMLSNSGVLFSLTCQPTLDIAPHPPWLPGPCSLPLSPLWGSPPWLSGAQCPAWPYSLSSFIYSLSSSDITWLYFFKNFLFCIGVKPINKQCCDSFWWTTKEFSWIYTCIHSIHVYIPHRCMDTSIHISTHLPSMLPHNIGQSSLCYTVGPCWFSILNITRVYMTIPNSLIIPSPLHSTSNHVCSLSLWVSCSLSLFCKFVCIIAYIREVMWHFSFSDIPWL